MILTNQQTNGKQQAYKLRLFIVSKRMLFFFFRRQKSKSCSELPFSSHRVQKNPNQRPSNDFREDPLNNVLRLQGQSFSAISFSSFDTLPAITPDPPNSAEIKNNTKEINTGKLSVCSSLATRA